MARFSTMYLTRLSRLCFNGIRIATVVLLASILPTRAAQNEGHAGEYIGAMQTGIKSGQIITGLDREMIDAFNLNLMLSFSHPGTPSYPVSPGVSLQLTRFYNSNLRKATAIACVEGGYDPEYYSINTQRIRRTNPIGFGWELNPGKIIRTYTVEGATTTMPHGALHWAYIGADGSEKILIPTSDPDVYTTRDGTHLRGTRQADSSWTLETADGLIMEFDHSTTNHARFSALPGCPLQKPSPQLAFGYADDPVDMESGAHQLDADYHGWFLTSVRSKLATDGVDGYTVTYHPYPFDYIPATLEDRWGRVITVGVGNGYQAGDVRNGAIESLTFPAPGGSTQTYSFEYEWQDLNVIMVQPHTQRVRVLTKAIGPLGYADEYTYVQDTSAVQNHEAGGQLESVRYPSGQLVKFHYGGITYWSYERMKCVLQPGTENGLQEVEKFSHGFGMYKKDLYLAGVDTGIPDATWQFSVWREVESESTPGGPCGQLWEKYYYATVRMTDPAGNVHKKNFRTQEGNFGRLAEAITYQGPEATGNIRSRTFQQGLLCEESYGALNLRDCVEQTTTQYFYDASGVEEGTLTTTNYDLDGFHHPQEVWQSGSALGGTIITRSDYAVDNESEPGVLCPSAQALKDNWLGSVLVSSDTTSSDMMQTLHGFDPQTGRVLSEVRVTDPVWFLPDPCMTDPSPIGETVPLGAEKDVVTRRTFDALGQMDSETVSIRDGSSSYTTLLTWDGGMITSVKKQGAGYFDRVIVNNLMAGLKTDEYALALDTSGTGGVHAHIEYDGLRRPVFHQVGSDAPSIITYENELVNGALRLKSARIQRGDTEAVDIYDFAGQVIESQQIHVDGRPTTVTKRTYNPMGWVLTESQPCSEAEHTAGTCGLTVNDYADPVTGMLDPQGRPRKVTSPAGEVVELAYGGISQVTTRKGVPVWIPGTPSTSSIRDISKLTLTDALGRLRIVDEDYGNSADPNRGADAYYEYHVSGNLRFAQVLDQVVAVPNTVSAFDLEDPLAGVWRMFEYDSLGNLLSEDQPESGLKEFDAFDAVGTPTWTRDAMGERYGYHLETELDSFGRPLKTWKVRDGLAADLLLARYSFDSGLEGWTAPGGGAPIYWQASTAYACGGSGAFEGSGALVYGNETTCTYADAPVGPVAIESPTIAGVDAETTLQFKERRSLRDPGSSVLDEAYLEIEDIANPAVYYRVFYRNSGHTSWNSWQSNYAIRLGDYLPFAFSTKTIRLRFVFVRGDSATSGLGKGWLIDDVVVLRQAQQLLTETVYDTDPCQGTMTDLCSAEPNWPVVSPKYWGRTTSVTRYGQDVIVPISGPIVNRPVSTTLSLFSGDSARLVAFQTDMDWTQTGAPHSFATKYRYDSLGNVINVRYPQRAGESARTYTYGYVESLLRTIGDSDGRSYLDGIDYTSSSAPDTVSYANTVATTYGYDVANRIESISSRQGSEPAFFAPGIYNYHGGELVGIGADTFGYDSTGRLVTANTFGYQLDYSYDPWANMLSRTVVPGTGLPPAPGLAFTGRKYAEYTEPPYIYIPNNRIWDAGYEYDENGNMLARAAQDGVTGTRHTFDVFNQMKASYWNDPGRTPAGVYLYDAGSLRIVNRDLAAGDTVTLSVRDGSGAVLAEYKVLPDSPDAKRKRDYIMAGDRVIAENAPCGPTPHIAYLGSSVTMAQFRLWEWIPAVGDYILSVRSASTGQRKFIEIPVSSLQLVTETSEPYEKVFEFWVSLSEFFQNDDNYVSIEGRAACGVTGYSNDVLQSAAILEMPPGSREVEPWVIAYIWSRPLAGLDEPPGLPSDLIAQVEILPDPGGGCCSSNPPTPGPIETITTWYHQDHLGSTRALTDEYGATLSLHDYFPFGWEVPTSDADSWISKRFTGHERDASSGLDYMMARYCAPALGRFLSADPIADQVMSSPHTWNRYTYVRNTPLRSIDPYGTEYIDQEGQRQANAVRNDPARTPVEVATVNNADGIGMKISTKVSPDAAMKITPAGTAPGVDGLAPGEILFTGDPQSIGALGRAHLAQGDSATLIRGTSEPGGTSSDGTLVDGKITAFEGSEALRTPIAGGRSVADRVTDTFIHESRHFYSGAFNPERIVQQVLSGTPSQ